MRIIKIIAGLGCLFVAFLLGLFALFSFREWGNIFVAFVPVVFTLCLLVTGGFLIAKWRSPVSKRIWVFIFFATGVFIAGCVILDAHIRQERKALQTRAKEFLSRTIPSILETNSIDGYQARPNETVLSGSRALIERYANNGRIRWSAAIQGQFAVQPFETASCEDADVVKTNKEARLYVADCKAIIDEEWRMGFWQWVEDTIEMKHTIPEIEEEDALFKNYKFSDSTNTTSLQ